ncbi:hypothetical protein ScPMuIL_002211, partial [Solemya velum]
RRLTKEVRPIRRPFEGRDVPLPKNWANFLSLPENKADLAQFLSEELCLQAPDDQEIVVAGGFKQEQDVRSSKNTIDLTHLRARHEQTDTRMVLHALYCQSSAVVVSSRDTDVLVLLVSYYPHFQCEHLWMLSGTAKKRKCIPIDAWKVFMEHHQLLKNLGIGETIHSTETFVCRMYDVHKTNYIDEARYILFSRTGKPESMSPTSDALNFHLMRAHYQAMVWRNAHGAILDLPAHVSMEWKRSDSGLQPISMSLNPIPDSCLEIITCGCQKQHKTQRCKCRKSRLQCTAMC